MIDPYLNSHDIFLTGGRYGVKANSTLELEFLKYFTQKAGVKYYLSDESNSYAILYNKYLQTGDEAFLKIAFDSKESTLFWTNEQYDKWKKIYQYNLTLPEDKKIVVIGPDLEFNYSSIMWSLNYLLPKADPPKEIDAIVTELRSYSKNEIETKVKFYDFCDRLNKSIKTNHKIYEDYLGESLFDFELISDNTLYAIEANNLYQKRDNSFSNYRDSKTYDNFYAITSRLPKGKFFGQLGSNQIFQKKQQSVKWLGACLNNPDSQFNNKVLSILYLYKNCNAMANTDNYPAYSFNDYNDSDKVFTDFIDSNNNNFTLFSLEGNKSPYSRKLLWYYKDIDYNIGSPLSGVTTDYFQFIVLVKNSKAESAYNK